MCTALGTLWAVLGVTGFVFGPDLSENWFRVLSGLVWLLFACRYDLGSGSSYDPRNCGSCDHSSPAACAGRT